MKLKWIRSVSNFIVVVLFSAGCVPVSIPDNPEIKGLVIDAATKSPISGAAISLISWPDKPALAILHSEADGKFKIARAQHTQWIPVGYDLFLPPITISAEAVGHGPFKVEVSRWLPEWTGTIELSQGAAAN